MLLVNARLGPSKIHGVGLIAHEFIPAGATVWVLRADFDVVLTEAQLHALSAPSRDQVRNYAFFDQWQGIYILSSDDDRFTNHADDPNTRVDGDYAYAIRDIRQGDEITCDYRDFDRKDKTGGKRSQGKKRENKGGRTLFS